MKIAYICTDRNLALFGNTGRAAYIQEVLRALVQRGAQVHLYGARLDGDRPEGLQNIAVHKLTLFGADLSSDENAMLRANRELRRLLDGSRGGTFECIIERFSPWSYAAAEYAKANKIASVLEVTDSGIDDFLRLKPNTQRIAGEVLQNAGTILAGSQRILEDLKAHGISSRRVPGTLDPERYTTGARLTIRKTGAFTVGYLGAFASWESLRPLVEAFALLHRKHPEARLLVEGDGPAKTQMITELSRVGLLGTAFFLGKVPARRIAGVLAAADVTVICDERDQATVHDSMLAGVPVVSCLLGDPLVRDRVNGLRCAGTEAELFAALETLYNDRILRLRLGSNARRSLLSNLVWDEIAACLIERSRQSESPGTFSIDDYLPASHATVTSSVGQTSVPAERLADSEGAGQRRPPHST